MPEIQHELEMLGSAQLALLKLARRDVMAWDSVCLAHSSSTVAPTSHRTRPPRGASVVGIRRENSRGATPGNIAGLILMQDLRPVSDQVSAAGMQQHCHSHALILPETMFARNLI